MDELENGLSNVDLFDEVDNTDTDVLTIETPTKEEAPKEDRSDSQYYENNNETEEYTEEDLLSDDNQVEDTEEEEAYVPDSHYVLQHLRDMGYFNYNDEDIANLEDDDVEAFMENQMDSLVRESVAESLSKLPPILRDLNMYALEGGDITQFFSQIAANNSVGISEGMDLSDPSIQEHIVRYTLASQGYDQNYINSNIEFLTNSNNLQTHAESYYIQHINFQRAQREEMVIRQQEEAAYREQVTRNYYKQMKDYVSKATSIGDIPLSLRDKNDIADYMLTPSIQLQDGTSMSNLQKDLYYEVMNNHEAAMQLALLLKNRKEDGTFDFSFMQRQAETKVANKARQGIRRQQNTVPSNASGSTPNYKNKTLADYF